MRNDDYHTQYHAQRWSCLETTTRQTTIHTTNTECTSKDTVDSEQPQPTLVMVSHKLTRIQVLPDRAPGNELWVLRDDCESRAQATQPQLRLDVASVDPDTIHSQVVLFGQGEIQPGFVFDDVEQGLNQGALSG